MANLRKFLLLTWKNAILQKRQKVVTVLEILLPVGFFIITYIIRGLVPFVAVTEPVTWNSFQVDQLPPSLVPPTKPGSPQGTWRIAYAPNVSVVNRIMSSATKRINTTEIGFTSEEKLVAFFKNDVTGSETSDVLLGVVFIDNFPNADQLATNITYKIRPKSQQKLDDDDVALLVDSEWYTNLMFPSDAGTSGPREEEYDEGGDPGYYRQGFLSVQRAVDVAIVTELNIQANVSDIPMEMKRSPFPPHTEDDFIYFFQYYLSFTFILSFIVFAPNIVKDICLEKEKKLKETMKLMGLNNWIHWCAWFTKCFILMLIIVSIITMLLYLKNGGVPSINYTDWFIVFLFILLYTVATIFFCFAISTFFSKASSGAAAGGILFLVTYLPYIFIQFDYTEMSTGEKLASCLLHNVAMCYGCYLLGLSEGKGIGLSWDNFYEPVNADDGLTMAYVMLMLIIDCFLYAIITWYVDAVYPGEFGIPKPLYFPFMKSYWCGVSDVDNDDQYDRVDELQESDIYEKNLANLRPSIVIRKLRKVFGKGKKAKVAVNNLSLDFYENQITAFLGHNGAGKSTTMFMLTGFIPPTSGKATVYGYDIYSESDKIRESLGYCPQHDILFDTLTVEEHLYFYAKLRNVPEVENEITVMLKKLNLEKKRKALASSLSGGMKRRLSVGIAFLGSTKTVILDEPTSGMDPEARRQIWDILEWERKGRTIILSTHFMEEADYLGDRIAIIARGGLQCCGSSLFLKSKYGVGYHMRIVKNERCDVEKITNLVSSLVVGAQFESNVSTELTYLLPRGSVAQFAALFSTLEQNKQALGISSFGASLTTMEEVFLKVGDIADDEEKTNHVSLSNGNKDVKIIMDDPQPNGHTNKAYENHLDKDGKQAIDDGSVSLEISYEKNSGYVRIFQQFYAMFLKRVIHTWKNRLVTAIQLIVPVGFTTVICIVIQTLPIPGDPAPLLLNLNNFKSPVSPYSLLNSTNNDNSNKLSAFYSKYLNKQTVSTPFVNNQSGYETNPDVESYLVDMAKRDLQSYINSYITAASFQTLDSWRSQVINFFNNEAFHSPAVSLNIFGNTMLHYFTNASFELNTINHPLPRLDNEQVSQTLAQQQQLGSSVSSNIAFGMCFLIATFVLFLIKERNSGSKHLQFVSGVHIANFWSSTFIWDFINYMVPCLLLIAIFAIFQLEAYVENAGIVLLIFVLFGWSVLPSTYLVSFLFTVASSGFVWTVILNIFSGLTAMLVISILLFYESTYDIGIAVEWIFYIFLPNYCFGQSLQNLYINHETLKACEDLEASFGSSFNAYCALLQTANQTNPCCKSNCGDECADYEENYFAWDKPGVGKGVTFMAFQGFFFFFCLFLLESQVFRRFRQNWLNRSTKAVESSGRNSPVVSARTNTLNELDSDVRQESERVLSMPIEKLFETNAVVLRQLRKYYSSHLAVKGLTFSIPPGECFGLLGVNGAGKTTTFKMISGDSTVSDGDAYLAGCNISKQVRRAQQKLGYCPQFDAIIEQMTVIETLTMYARLRGIKEADIGRVVDQMIRNLQLQQHADKQAQQLSGGNKRKLNTAIALIGDPPIICLDEPTTGMDPGARRYLWKVLTALREKGRTIILTSHSMEECEALCSRIGIMVNGQLKCLGSSQHLKAKFGDGYTAVVKLKATDETDMKDQTKKMIDYIEKLFPGSVLKDKHSGLLQYQIPSNVSTWSSVFSAMENAREFVNVDDYSVSEVLLEQIFIGFAKEQMAPEIHETSCCKKCFGFFCCCCMCEKDEPKPYVSSSSIAMTQL